MFHVVPQFRKRRNCFCLSHGMHWRTVKYFFRMDIFLLLLFFNIVIIIHVIASRTTFYNSILASTLTSIIRRNLTGGNKRDSFIIGVLLLVTSDFLLTTQHITEGISSSAFYHVCYVFRVLLRYSTQSFQKKRRAPPRPWTVPVAPHHHRKRKTICRTQVRTRKQRNRTRRIRSPYCINCSR